MFLIFFFSLVEFSIYNGSFNILFLLVALVKDKYLV